jgi:ribosome-associated translation inhibitor RaiA
VKGAIIMADTPMVQIQAETRGAVPEGAVDLAIRRIGSLLRMASEPVLFARVKLIMSADPAVQRPAIAQANIDLNGRLIRAQAADETMRAAVQHACNRLRIRLERAARNWEAVRAAARHQGPASGGTRAFRRRACPITLARRGSGLWCGTSPTRWPARPRMRQPPTPS